MICTYAANHKSIWSKQNYNDKNLGEQLSAINDTT